MKFKETKAVTSVTILANDHYVGKPITLDFTSVTNGIVKAGTPINASGVADNTKTATGILLYDVTENNPNGTIVIHGFIDTTKAQTHSGVTIDTTAKAALPMIAFI